MLPPLLPCCSLDYLGWQLLNQPFLFYIFFIFPPVSPPFPARRLQLFCGFLCFFAFLLPSPILSSFPLSSSPFPFPSGVRLRVPTPVSVSVLAPAPVLRSFVHLHPRSRSVPMTVHVPVLVSVPTPDSNPAPDSFRSFLSHGLGYPPGTMRLYRRRALRMGLSGARKRHPLSAEMVTRAE